MNGLPIRTGHPNRRVGLLYWLGEHVARGHGEVFADEARVGVHHHHIGDLFDSLPPHRTTLSRVYTNPSSSARDADSPVPQSTRPPETKSRVATRSATRAGGLYPGGIKTMPCPRRMRRERWDAAARNTSGAEECEYSSRKWCSTSQA